MDIPIGRGTGRRILRVAALVSAIALCNPAAAFGHSVLESSDPADGSTLTAVPRKMTFSFYESIQDRDASIVLTEPDGDEVRAEAVEVDGNQLRGTFAGTFSTGAYVVVYRYTSLDGDPGKGEIGFEVALSSPAEFEPGSDAAEIPPDSTQTPVAEAATSRSTSTTAQSNSASGDVGSSSNASWPVALAAAVVGSIIWLFVRRRAQHR